MPLNAAVCNQQIDASMSSIVMLNASCQAVIEAEIQQVDSSWYKELDQELGAAEELVLAWRHSGVFFFQSVILQAITAAGQNFVSSQAEIDALFALLLGDSPPPDAQAKVIAALDALRAPVQSIVAQTDDYLARLKAFESQMTSVQEAMEATVAAVQQQETELQAQIKTINAEIASLQQQIATDRDAIRRAESKRTSGIVETIFGVLLAPVTGGASLILAGIGVASITEAELKIASMEGQISSYQQTITNDQATLTSDKQIVVSLKALTMSTGIVLDDIDDIEGALDALRATWTAFDDEAGNIVANLRKSSSAQVAIVSQAWYDAASREWNLIARNAEELAGQQLTSRRIDIG